VDIYGKYNALQIHWKQKEDYPTQPREDGEVIFGGLLGEVER
jgi:hypothetical protein